MEYKISLGHSGPTDCTLKINDKEYLIETRAWNLISLLKYYNIQAQKLLKYIYDNFDEDLGI